MYIRSGSQPGYTKVQDGYNDRNRPAHVVPLRAFNDADDADLVSWLRSLNDIDVWDEDVAHSPEQLNEWVRPVDRLLRYLIILVCPPCQTFARARAGTSRPTTVVSRISCMLQVE
ncbi:hypothetical protein HO133_002339 [Letharia lupina]|uniref:Uncharacterized protein n=1 Tax=Letharia lupina TaxID=560253 RepID=A0A8H6CDP8_9LECA|nr:uncharacterized protein HO133_002339 [Letharia lupina]KAF6221483.1 hypothetical protein HO133_002339 [Letharia lupina]